MGNPPISSLRRLWSIIRKTALVDYPPVALVFCRVALAAAILLPLTLRGGA
ncbi:MAG: hypothetical protein ACLPYS_11965 [Vulcanimicrobiaceae bacterium]